jgi:NADH:ubiquinone oxidoreductase subunit E
MSKTSTVQFCNGQACTQAETQHLVFEWLQDYFTKDEISECSCLGLCHDNHAILYKGKAYSVFTKKALDRIIKFSVTS